MKKISLLAFLLIGFITISLAQTEEVIFQIVEQMPRFPGCEQLKTKRDKDDCSMKNIMEYIYSNLEYPEEAIKNKVEGRVVVRFIVSDTGEIKNVKILRGIGSGCDEAAKKVILGMNNMGQKWIPGSQGGKKVNVFYTMPIIFRLDNYIKKEDSIDINKKSSEKVDTNKIYYQLEQMPVFPGCEDQADKEKTDSCSWYALQQLYYRYLRYPAKARKKGITGRVVIGFVIDRHGQMKDIKVLKDIGGGCGKAALKAFDKIKEIKWKPGVLNGQNVNVHYTFPVKFYIILMNRDKKVILK